MCCNSRHGVDAACCLNQVWMHIIQINLDKTINYDKTFILDDVLTHKFDQVNPFFFPTNCPSQKGNSKVDFITIRLFILKFNS